MPRSGTSLVAGLVRILGFDMPGHPTVWRGDCHLSENPNWRRLGPLSRAEVLQRINGAEDGIVWKDPTIAPWAQGVDWGRWRIVRVYRQRYAVIRSEQKWDGTRSEYEVGCQYDEWNHRLDRALNGQEVLGVRMCDVYDDPVMGLDALASWLEVPIPPRGRMFARRFVAGPGYRCPRGGQDIGRCACVR